MDQLRDFLLARIPPRISGESVVIWERFVEAARRVPLEAALHEVQLNEELMGLVIEATRECCFPRELDVLDDLVRSAVEMPLARLYRHVFRSTHPRLAVVTTNYDRLAEYAADWAGFGWSTGFGCGYVGQRHAARSVTILRDGIALRMVDIWKVHGSLDWFRAPDGRMFSLPAFTHPPEGLTPLMVTPGIDKYRRAYAEPFRTAIAGADDAIEKGAGFLCIGYGFNDEHVQPKLLDQCRREEKPIVVLAKELTPTAREFLLDGRCRHFLACEEAPGGTRVFTGERPSGILLDGVNLWSLGPFLDAVL